MYALTPTKTEGDFEIVRGYVTYSHLMAKITLDYAHAPDGGMGIAVYPIDADGGRIEPIYSNNIRISENEYRLTFESASEITAPEMLAFEAKRIGKAEIVGRIECRLTPVERTDMPPATQYEETRAGLTFQPVGEWTGAKINLIEGGVSAGRRVQITFEYIGDAEKLRFAYKNSVGDIVGEAVESSTVSENGRHIRVDKLDGSGWPFELIIEISSDGELIDAFVCNLY